MRTLVAFMTAVVLASPAFAQVQKQERAGIRNFSRVDATVSCGGAVDASAYPGLKQDGFVSVINLRLASEPGANIDEARAAAASAGLNYIHLPFNVAQPDSAVVDRFLAAVSTPANQPVLVHCGSANRVGGVWMIKRVLQDGWAIDRARAEAEAIGLNSPQMAAFALEYINTHRR
ncbi:MAG: sulfur transferase domain-containing protein [Vicinamibacterales bacterium]